MEIQKEQELSERKIWILGLTTYTALFVLAIVFYKERTIFTDAAFRFFYIFKNNDFALQENRFGSIFSQSFLFFSYKLGLPLKQIMINYSIGFVLCQMFVFTAILKWFKNKELALVLLLLNVFMVAQTFYWIQSELVEGLPYLLLYFAGVKYLISEKLGKKKPFLFVFLLGLLVMVAFFHPLIFIAFSFVTLFFVLESNTRKERLFFFAGLPLVILILVIKVLFVKTQYDNWSMHRVYNIWEFFPYYYNLPSFKTFFRHSLQDYYFLLPLLIAVVVYYKKKKEIAKMTLLVFFFIAYLILIIASYPKYAIQFHLESFYMPLSLFVLLPFVLDILPKLEAQKALVLLSILLLVRVGHIGLEHRKFTPCLNWKREVLTQTMNLKEKKLLIKEELVPKGKNTMSWGSPYEFWLLSTLEFETSRSIFIYNNIKSLRKWGKHTKNKALITEWAAVPYEKLPAPYFNFQDTSTYVEYNPESVKD